MIDFTHRAYCELLEYIKGQGHRILPFRDIPTPHTQPTLPTSPYAANSATPRTLPRTQAVSPRQAAASGLNEGAVARARSAVVSNVPKGTLEAVAEKAGRSTDNAGRSAGTRGGVPETQGVPETPDGVPESGRYVVLRHDIDFSVAKAEEMAVFDHQAGVQSTFFVLLTTPYYNPLDEENLRILRRIIGMGHEIGLHYDCSGFDALTFDEQYRRIQSLAACLESHLDIQVKAIAQHKPAAATMHPEFPGYMDPYSHALFRNVAYISDSRMRFRVKDVYAFFRENPRCQAVLHPIWWHAQPKTRAQIFEEIKTLLAQQFSRMIDDDHQVILDSLPEISPQA